LYPHQGDWKTAGTVSRAFAWVHPVLSLPMTKKGTGALPSECSFVRIDVPNVMITAVKRAEDDDDMIVRFYEAYGLSNETTLRTMWTVQSVISTNFLEDPVAKADAVMDRLVKVKLRGYEIRTLKLKLALQPGVTLSGAHGPGPVRPF